MCSWAETFPPFGSAAVIVEERDHYLVVELPRGRVAFPGGFMIWREHPKQTAQREAQEETGLLVRVGDLIDTYSSISEHFTYMSVVSLVYAAEVIGGMLRPSGPLVTPLAFAAKAEYSEKEKYSYILCNRGKRCAAYRKTRCVH